MKKVEIINREVRDVTYEIVITDEQYEEMQSLSQSERLAFLEMHEQQWQMVDYGMKRINTPKGLNIQQADIDKGRRVTKRYEQLYSTENHDIEADPELRKEKMERSVYRGE
ncbi:hypothetical protein [Endozoicomonas ascidiicola]|uniref:hypothetical protein n=1 Tax=Endozoicomonas ascidiicola TaxID=1698521 RepID=UPI000837A5BE|nr:hypothetical protein [Endozoicomonas ascidiicola]